VRTLGKAESKEAEQESLLLEFDVPYRPFGRAILDCLPPEGDSWTVPPKSEGGPVWTDREDLRELVVCSIDPPGNISSFVLIHGASTICQGARILMMRCMHVDYPTGISRLACVSNLGCRLFDILLTPSFSPLTASAHYL